MRKSKWENYSDEELLQMVKDLAEKLGKSPIVKDVELNNNIAGYRYYLKRFNVNQWEDIVRMCGLIHLKDIYTKDFALNKLVEYYNILGRIPNRLDFKNNKWIPHYNWYSSNFKNSLGQYDFNQALYEAGIIKECKQKIEITEEVQNLINDVIKSNNDIKFKKCTMCGRSLPLHNYFYGNSNASTYGFTSSCKECINKKTNYKFADVLNQSWYIDKESEFKKMFRIMSLEELMGYYGKTKQDILNARQFFKLKTMDYIGNLSKEEVIFIYNSILNNKRDDFPDGFVKIYKYKIWLVEYLINDILQLDTREKICNEFDFKFLIDYRLAAIKNNNPFQVLCNTFPDYKFMKWEIKKSSVGNDFWNDKNKNIAINWLRDRLFEDKKITTIHQAKKYGFLKILNEYNLFGLYDVNRRFNVDNMFDMIDFFENVFGSKLFNQLDDDIRNNENIIYEIKNNYYKLKCTKKKELIDEIIKFCELENRFPYSWDLTNSNGYIGFSTFRKYFGENAFCEVYKYIQPKDRGMSNVWTKPEFRIDRIKKYCEQECVINILNVINKTEDLIDWFNKYFTKKIIDSLFCLRSRKDIYLSRYDLLIEAYPIILKNKLLFEWELPIYTMWHRHDYHERLNLMLRELVLYRLNHVILDLKVDIPRYIKLSFLDLKYSKFNKYVYKRKVESYYDWSCSAFPEFKDVWSKSDFENNVAADGTVCDSFEEVQVYEYIKYSYGLNNLKHVGKNRIGDHVFYINNDEYEKFCPDFVFEKNDKGFNLNKNLYIEYYGMYQPKISNYKIINLYNKKTESKNHYYKNNNDIYFIDLYSSDIKNNFEGIRLKLDKFFNEYNKNIFNII